MELSFLPEPYLKAIEKINLDNLYEIRLRKNFPVMVNYDNHQFYLNLNGIREDKDQAIICTVEDLNYIMKSVTEHSIYAFNDRIKEGFITTANGIRIGIAGECVFFEKHIQTIKNISSLNIRIPHKIFGCSNNVFEYIFNSGKVLNTLIISPPAFGKTTLLKDLSEKLSESNIGSILIIDERAEFSDVDGQNIDKIIYSDKFYAFSYGIRSMSPKIIITDELSTSDDWKCVFNASTCGVKVIASCHGSSVDDVAIKNHFIKNVFNLYVVLDGVGKPGQVKGIYDKEFKKI